MLKIRLRKGHCWIWLLILMATPILFSHSVKSTLSIKTDSDYFAITTSSIFSTNVNDNYTLLFAVPSNYNETGDQYPTIYLLDAAYHFDGTHPVIGMDVGPGGIVEIVRDLISEKFLPPSIVVGIDYEGDIDSQRWRDFRDNREPFYHFVINELIPYVDSSFRTNSRDRTLLGHSLGGTFATYCLFQYNNSIPPLFNRFVSLSGNYRTQVFDVLTTESMLYQRLNNSTNISFNVSVFLAVGEHDSYFVTENVDLINRLNSRDYNDFKFFGKIYENLDHSTIVRPGFIDGMKWIFCTEIAELTNTTSVTSTDPEVTSHSSESSDPLIRVTNYTNCSFYFFIVLVILFRFVPYNKERVINKAKIAKVSK